MYYATPPPPSTNDDVYDFLEIAFFLAVNALSFPATQIWKLWRKFKQTWSVYGPGLELQLEVGLATSIFITTELDQNQLPQRQDKVIWLFHIMNALYLKFTYNFSPVYLNIFQFNK